MNPFPSMLRGLLPALLCASALAQAPAECPPTAQAPTPEQVQAGVRNALDHGFLWRISKGGHSSWLFGTLHVAKFEWMFPGPKVGRALMASDTIALELDPLDPDIQQRMAQGMASRPATPLPDALQERLRRQAQGECIPPLALAGFGPELQIAALTTLAGRRDGLDPAYGLENFLSGWGLGQKKVVVSLETPELQLKALQMGSAAETIEFVTNALDELESGQAGPMARRIAQVWADGDLDALTRYESWCDCLKTATDRAAMARLLDDRNPAMADGIAALHTGGRRVFAAVGSLHMIGPQGLPALMAKRGYRVERIIYAR
jgi:uncharacterized protein YbaP (TraB family)